MYLGAFLAPAAVLLVAKGDGGQIAEAADVAPLAAPAPEAVPAPGQDSAPAPGNPCCMEIVAAPGLPTAHLTAEAPAEEASSVELVSASRWRVVSRTLPAGVAPERGLQVRTILAARSISAVFPEINEIGGVCSDALRWHPNGLALDVMIPNNSSAEGIALGNAIVAYVLQNADRFGIQDAIWRGVYYTPNGARSGGYGHYDHVHITTTGGGYPTGNELYFR